MQTSRHRAPAPPDPEAWTRQAPLRELLANLAGEAADLARSADRLQALFGQLMSDPPVRPGDALEQAQALDGLVQRLQGMGAFLSDLSSRALHDLPAETAQAAFKLRLTSQGRRFSANDAAVEPDADPGEFDLF